MGVYDVPVDVDVPELLACSEEDVGGRLTLDEVVGKGGFATVWRATFDGHICACKVLQPRGGTVPPAPIVRLFIRECSSLMGMDHSAVVRCMGLLKLRREDVPALGLNYDTYGMLLEFCEGGTLKDLLLAQLVQMRDQYTVREALAWLAQVASALNQFHSLTAPIIHRDIKPENILLQTPDPITDGDTLAAAGRQSVNRPGVGARPQPRVPLTAKLADLGLGVRVGADRSVLVRRRTTPLTSGCNSVQTPSTATTAAGFNDAALAAVLGTDGHGLLSPVPTNGAGEGPPATGAGGGGSSNKPLLPFMGFTTLPVPPSRRHGSKRQSGGGAMASPMPSQTGGSGVADGGEGGSALLQKMSFMNSLRFRLSSRIENPFGGGGGGGLVRTSGDPARSMRNKDLSPEASAPRPVHGPSPPASPPLLGRTTPQLAPPSPSPPPPSPPHTQSHLQPHPPSGSNGVSGSAPDRGSAFLHRGTAEVVAAGVAAAMGGLSLEAEAVADGVAASSPAAADAGMDAPSADSPLPGGSVPVGPSPPGPEDPGAVASAAGAAEGVTQVAENHATNLVYELGLGNGHGTGRGLPPISERSQEVDAGACLESSSSGSQMSGQQSLTHGAANAIKQARNPLYTIKEPEEGPPPLQTAASHPPPTSPSAADAASARAELQLSSTQPRSVAGGLAATLHHLFNASKSLSRALGGGGRPTGPGGGGPDSGTPRAVSAVSPRRKPSRFSNGGSPMAPIGAPVLYEADMGSSPLTPTWTGPSDNGGLPPASKDQDSELSRVQGLPADPEAAARTPSAEAPSPGRNPHLPPIPPPHPGIPASPFMYARVHTGPHTGHNSLSKEMGQLAVGAASARVSHGGCSGAGVLGATPTVTAVMAGTGSRRTASLPRGETINSHVSAAPLSSAPSKDRVDRPSAALSAVVKPSLRELTHMDSISRAMRRIGSLLRTLNIASLPKFRPDSQYQWVYALTGQAGSCMYMAPEVFRGEPYNEKVDVFSFGVMMFEVLGRDLLLVRYLGNARAGQELGIKDPPGYARKVCDGFRPPRSPRIPETMWQLIQLCWHPDPVVRPDMSEVQSRLEIAVQEWDWQHKPAPGVAPHSGLVSSMSKTRNGEGGGATTTATAAAAAQGTSNGSAEESGAKALANGNGQGQGHDAVAGRGLQSMSMGTSSDVPQEMLMSQEGDHGQGGCRCVVS